MTLGQKLKEIRKRFCLSQEELATIVNVSRQAITKWENDCGLPDVSNLQEISKVFGITVDYLLNDDNPGLRVIDDKVFVYGAPWSGKTPCYKQRKAEVGALVMLEQKPYNYIERQGIINALSSLMCSCSIMIWDKPSYNSIMNTMSEVITFVPIYHLSCLPDKEAAELSYKTIVKVV